MPKYIVTTMIQSADIDNNEPVQVRRGDEKIVVVCEHHFNNPPE